MSNNNNNTPASSTSTSGLHDEQQTTTTTTNTNKAFGTDPRLSNPDHTNNNNNNNNHAKFSHRSNKAASSSSSRTDRFHPQHQPQQQQQAGHHHHHHRNRTRSPSTANTTTVDNTDTSPSSSSSSSSSYQKRRRDEFDSNFPSYHHQHQNQHHQHPQQQQQNFHHHQPFHHHHHQQQQQPYNKRRKTGGHYHDHHHHQQQHQPHHHQHYQPYPSKHSPTTSTPVIGGGPGGGGAPPVGIHGMHGSAAGGGRFTRGYQGAQIVAAQWSERQDFKHGNGIPQTNFNHRIFFSYLDRLAQTPYIDEVKRMFSDIHVTISGSRYDSMYRVCMILLTPQEYACFDMRQVIGDMVESFYYDGAVLVILPREKPLSNYKRRLLDRFTNWLRTTTTSTTTTITTSTIGDESEESRESVKQQLLERLNMGTEMVLNYFGFTGLIGSVVLKKKSAEKPYPTNGALRHILDPFIAIFLAICDLRENIDIVQSKNTEDLLQLKDTMTKFMPSDFLNYPTVSIGANQAIALLRALKDYLCKAELPHVKDHYKYEFANKLPASIGGVGSSSVGVASVGVSGERQSDVYASHYQQQAQAQEQQQQQQQEQHQQYDGTVTATTSHHHHHVNDIESQPLPDGWEVRYDQEGRRYFVHLKEWKSQWEDPREQQQQQQLTATTTTTTTEQQQQEQQTSSYQTAMQSNDHYAQYDNRQEAMNTTMTTSAAPTMTTTTTIANERSDAHMTANNSNTSTATTAANATNTTTISTTTDLLNNGGNSSSSSSSSGSGGSTNAQKEPYTIEQLHQVLNSHNFKRISHTLDRNAYRDLCKCQTPHDFAKIIIRLKGNWKHVFCEHRFKQEYTKHNSEYHTCAFAHSEEERNYWDSIRNELGIVINDR